MIHHFDHRFGDYADLPARSKSTELPDVPLVQKQNPAYVVQPRYWVPEAKVEARLAGKWDRQWLLGWRDITNVTNERTVIASVVPRVGLGHTWPVFLGRREPSRLVCLMCALSSFAADFVARQKMGGTHLTYMYLNQLAVPSPTILDAPLGWCELSMVDWALPRALEHAYTAEDLSSFAADCGFVGPPFRWDEHRRFMIRCELDAAFFHLYGLNRDDVAYVMDSFPIVHRKDEAAHGEYRTKRVIVELYDAMTEARSGGRPFVSRLDPPPGVQA